MSRRKMNINTASFYELKTISYIGDKTANRIIERRKEINGFKNKYDLLKSKIRGFGNINNKTFKSILEKTYFGEYKPNKIYRNHDYECSNSDNEILSSDNEYVDSDNESIYSTASSSARSTHSLYSTHSSYSTRTDSSMSDEQKIRMINRKILELSNQRRILSNKKKSYTK